MKKLIRCAKAGCQIAESTSSGNLPFGWREIGGKTYCPVCTSSDRYNDRSKAVAEYGLRGFGFFSDKEPGRGKKGFAGIVSPPPTPKVERVESARELIARKRAEGKVVKVGDRGF